MGVANENISIDCLNFTVFPKTAALQSPLLRWRRQRPAQRLRTDCRTDERRPSNVRTLTPPHNLAAS